MGFMPETDQDEFAQLIASGMALTSDTPRGFDPGALISACLRRGASSRVHYQNMGENVPRRQLAPPRHSSDKPGRNSPCPCGSGKKYKQCCLKKARWENVPDLPGETVSTADPNQ
jgi:hypothetical protein